MWMNEMDVIEQTALWNGEWNHPTLGPATQTLFNLMKMVNSNSDGWPYWKKPANAAEIRKAYTPIKAFITRMGGGNFAIEFIEPR